MTSEDRGWEGFRQSALDPPGCAGAEPRWPAAWQEGRLVAKSRAFCPYSPRMHPAWGPGAALWKACAELSTVPRTQTKPCTCSNAPHEKVRRRRKPFINSWHEVTTGSASPLPSHPDTQVANGCASSRSCSPKVGQQWERKTPSILGFRALNQFTSGKVSVGLYKSQLIKLLYLLMIAVASWNGWRD